MAIMINNKKIKKVWIKDANGTRQLKKVWNKTGQLIFGEASLHIICEDGFNSLTLFNQTYGTATSKISIEDSLKAEDLTITVYAKKFIDGSVSEVGKIELTKNDTTAKTLNWRGMSIFDTENPYNPQFDGYLMPTKITFMYEGVLKTITLPSRSLSDFPNFDKAGMVSEWYNKNIIYTS